MVGYWATGSWKIETRPEITIKSERTEAKIGRSIKNLENIFDVYFHPWLKMDGAFYNYSLLFF
jgi:hypothetical protein